MHVQHQSGGISVGWLIARWNVGHGIRDMEEGTDGSLWMLEDANFGALIPVSFASLVHEPMCLADHSIT